MVLRREFIAMGYEGAQGVIESSARFLFNLTILDFISFDNLGPDFPGVREGIRFDRLSFAYEYVDLGSAPISTTRGPLAGTLQGDYSANSLNVIGFTVAHRF
jgi:hypothetical protein